MKILSKEDYISLKKRYLKNKVKVIAGDYKNKIYEVKQVSKKGFLLFKDLYGLNSKKKSYNWKIHYSNTSIL